MIQTLNTTTSNLFHPSFHGRTLRKLYSLPICRSSSKDKNSEPQGDPKKQEVLARIAMLEAQKLRLTDYLDERSSFLTQFAEDANAEFDAIGENALKDLDQATARIMENIESKMQEFEESSEMSKEEIAKRDMELAEFEGEMEKGRNEGLFFKSFKDKKAVDKDKAKEETNKIVDVTKDMVASKTRRNIYLALLAVVSIFIADSYIASSPDWRRIALLVAIFVGLLTQFFYEQNLLKQRDNYGKDDENR